MANVVSNPLWQKKRRMNATSWPSLCIAHSPSWCASCVHACVCVCAHACARLCVCFYKTCLNTIHLINIQFLMVCLICGSVCVYRTYTTVSYTSGDSFYRQCTVYFRLTYSTITGAWSLVGVFLFPILTVLCSGVYWGMHFKNVSLPAQIYSLAEYCTCQWQQNHPAVYKPGYRNNLIF